MARKFTLQFPPTSFVGGDTNTPSYVQHASTSGRIALAFDGAQTEGSMTVPWVMPDTYDAAANMTLKLYFYTTTGDAPDGDGIDWQVAFEKITPNPASSVAGDNLDLNGAQGLASGVTHTHEMAGAGTTAGEASVASITISNANTDAGAGAGGAAAGDLMRFVVQRLGAGDDYAADVFLTCVELYQE